MRYLTSAAAITIISALAFALTHGVPKAEAADEAKVYPMSYKLADLPVWSEDGSKCNPVLLMSHIKSTFDISHVAVSAKGASLVIGTTSQKHEAIRDFLERLRAKNIDLSQRPEPPAIKVVHRERDGRIVTHRIHGLANEPGQESSQEQD